MTPSSYTLLPGDLVDLTVNFKDSDTGALILRPRTFRVQVDRIRWSWRGLRWTVELRVDYDPI